MQTAVSSMRHALVMDGNMDGCPGVRECEVAMDYQRQLRWLRTRERAGIRMRCREFTCSEATQEECALVEEEEKSVSGRRRKGRPPKRRVVLQIPSYVISLSPISPSFITPYTLHSVISTPLMSLLLLYPKTQERGRS